MSIENEVSKIKTTDELLRDEMYKLQEQMRILRLARKLFNVPDADIKAAREMTTKLQSEADKSL